MATEKNKEQDKKASESPAKTDIQDDQRAHVRRRDDDRNATQLEMAQCLSRFTDTLSDSTKRLEVVVYPALFAFVVLAAYGFYLIFNLTRDINTLAENITEMTSSMNTMTTSMSTVSNHMVLISKNVSSMATKMDEMEPIRVTMAAMESSIRSMDANVYQMNRSTQQISMSSARMNHHVGNMDRGLHPIHMMNNFMPW